MSNKEDGKSRMAAFNVRDKSEEGVKVMLKYPDGTETNEYIIVRGADSPTFRKAQSEFNREKLELFKLRSNKKQTDQTKLDQRETKLRYKCAASLVAGWSFSENPTVAEITEFFDSAPQIFEQIDSFAADRSNFFNSPSVD